VAGRPALSAEFIFDEFRKGNSVTDRRQRFVFSWIADPKPFGRSQPLVSAVFNHWKASGVTTVGSRRPVDAIVTGDHNQGGYCENNRLPGLQSDSIAGPDYARPTFD
jgi:hypothetical protein